MRLFWLFKAPSYSWSFSLASYTYRIDSSNQDKAFVLACKKRVVQFVYRWVTTVRQPVFEDESAVEFIEDLAAELEADCMQSNALQEEASLMHHVLSQLRRLVQPRFLHESLVSF